MSNILGDPGDPDDMVNDVVDDIKACLQMASFSRCCALSSKSIAEFSTCVGARRLNTDGLIRLIMDIPGSEDESNKGTCFKRMGMLSSTLPMPLAVTRIIHTHIQKKMLRM